MYKIWEKQLVGWSKQLVCRVNRTQTCFVPQALAIQSLPGYHIKVSFASLFQIKQRGPGWSKSSLFLTSLSPMSSSSSQSSSSSSSSSSSLSSSLIWSVEMDWKTHPSLYFRSWAPDWILNCPARADDVDDDDEDLDDDHNDNFKSLWNCLWPELIETGLLLSEFEIMTQCPVHLTWVDSGDAGTS